MTQEHLKIENPAQRPAWLTVEGKPITPDEAKGIIESRPLPPNVYDPNALPVGALAAMASNTVAGAPSIVELARALKSDVDLIYEFCGQNIEVILNYGLHKGGLGALTDGMGNSFDQSDLMVSLLRQAGYTANYMHTTLDFSESQANAYFGTTNIWAARNLILNGGIPATVVWNGSENRLEFSHCYVKVQISGTWYVFDPAMKSYTYKTGISNLATILGYNQTTFLNNAKSGSSSTADYYKDLNKSNIASDLATMTGNLVNHIRTNMSGASLDDVLGGKTINVPTFGLRQTSLPYQKSGVTPTEWTSIPNTYKHTLRVQYDWNGSGFNIDSSFYTADVYGKRMTLFFNVSRQAELRLDGTLLGTSSVQGVGTWNSVLLTATHPYGGTWADQSVWHRVWAEKSYIIANGCGMTGRGFADAHRKKLDENKFAGLSDDNEAVLGESLEVAWFTENAETARSHDMIDRLTGCTTVVHHQVGLVGWYDTFLFDIGMVTSSATPLDNDYTYKPNSCRTAASFHGIMYEAAALKQVLGVGGVSSMRVFDVANTGHNKLFRATSSNWTTNVKPNLVGYSSQTLTDIENWYINSGYAVLIPENATQTVNQWQGYGYYAIPLSPYSGAIGIVSGGLKGAPGDEAKTKADGNKDAQKNGKESQKQTNSATKDPVDFQTGDFLFDDSELEVGSQDFPYGLAFHHSYRSNKRLVDGPLGLGWTHNWDITAKVNNDPFKGHGDEAVVAGAAAIVEKFVTADLTNDTNKPIDKLLVVVLCNQWLHDQLQDNTVVVSFGHTQEAFVKLPDGTYVPPGLNGNNSSLVKNVDQTYTYKTITGRAVNFNLDGTINTWVEPFGVTLSFTYSAGKLQTVSNGLGRTLTLTWTGNYVTSVTDGTSRSVGYTVDANKNLTTITDPDSKSSTFSYDIPGRLWKAFRPKNPATAVVENTYDSLGRVKEQRDALTNLTTFYLAGSRSEEVNAAGCCNKRIEYFNRKGNVVRSINATGDETKSEFDGIGRNTKVTLPEGNWSEFAWNSKSLLTQVIAHPKPGSPLSNITNSYTYDSTWNKVKTAIDGRGNSTTWNYDPSNGNLLNIQYPQVGGLTPQVSWTYNSRGQTLTKTDETGIVTQFTYDGSTEKLLTIVHDYGTSPKLNLTTSLGYTSRGDINSVTDPRGKITTFAFDIKRRMTQKTDPSPLSYVSNFYYDENDNRWKTERQTGDVMNPWQIYTATFDADDKLKTVTNPANDVTTWDYNNLRQLWKVTDSENRVTEYSYDSNGRLYTVKDPALVVAETRLYTNNGRLASIMDARSNTTQFTWDGFDRPDRTTHPNSNYEQNQVYDANGNVLTFRTRSGNTIVRTFDELNREKTRAPQGQPTVTNTYDLAGRLTKSSKPVVSGDPSTGDFEFFFDSAGRFYKEKYPDGKIVEHQLDANGNFIRTTWPDSYYIERAFDEINRLTGIKLNGAGTNAVTIGYDPLSRRTSMSYANGISTAYTHQLDDDLASIVHTFVGSNVTFTLGYDKVHRMTSQQVSDSQYLWHPAAAGTTTYGTANNMNQYPTVGGVSYSYNTNGCLTGDGTWTWNYDTENHLTTASKTGTSITNYWDPVHRQREHKVGSTRNRYIYAGQQRIADYSNTTLQNRYVYGTGLDEVLIKVSSAGVLTYYSHDHEGSVVALTNASGTVTNRYKYSPWGESPSMTGTTHGYTGQRFESESGLYYYKNRYYSPKLGRFLQPDETLADGLNLYTYVNNDPLNTVDPLGLFGCKVDINYLKGQKAGEPTVVKGNRIVVRGHGQDSANLGRHITDSQRADGTVPLDAKRFTQSDVVRDIKQNPNFKNAESIVLEVCNGGKCSNDKLVTKGKLTLGAPSLGETVAIKTGKDTYAYIGTVTTEGGVFIEGLNGTRTDGYEVLFEGGTGKVLGRTQVNKIQLYSRR